MNYPEIPDSSFFKCYKPKNTAIAIFLLKTVDV